MMNVKYYHRKKPGLFGSLEGYTLIEVLVTVTIFAVLAGAINMVLLVGESSWQTNSVRIELRQELRKAINKMEDELRQTSPVAITAGPTVANGSTSASITFYLPTGVSGNSITWSANTTQYKLGGTDSNQLQRIEGGNTEVIAQNIQSLTFSRAAATPDIIDVSLVAQKDTIKGIPLTVNFAFGVQMRN
ncbi:MAG: prepilin-type N-terminal cleavage/methylation domain-containing protein [Candidatus Omnitrophica bacterium]|nr:prepilin-type N-terminal cleavage/methylation domain-containing protein [Candidatus Omnitrophota bacterium]